MREQQESAVSPARLVQAGGDVALGYGKKGPWGREEVLGVSVSTPACVDVQLERS